MICFPKLPVSFTLDQTEYSVTYTPMSRLAELIDVHGLLVNGPDVMVQCATATEEWTDIEIPLEQALTLREKFSNLITSFASGKKGEPERSIRFARPVSRGSILEIIRFRYRPNRYMQALSEEEFNQRFNDIWINAFTLLDDGKYEMIQPMPDGMLHHTQHRLLSSAC
jgi:hypothetical protein